MREKTQSSASAGFTLVEVAMVVVIGGLMMAGAAVMLNDYLQAARLSTTQKRMQDIDNAITAYLSVNGVLPCVANLNDPQDSANFGKAIADGVNADCYATATAAGPGTYKLATGRNIAGLVQLALPKPQVQNGGIIEGAVPVRTLNLPDQEIADAWGNRFIYAVSDKLTVVGQYDQNDGSIAVVDSQGNSLATPTVPGSAQYVIVSLGADRAGAYSLAGVKGLACPVGAVETPNCTYPQKQFVSTLLNSSQTGVNAYDDLIVSHPLVSTLGNVPTGMIAAFPGNATCPQGWQIAPPPAGGCVASVGPPSYSCCQKQ